MHKTASIPAPLSRLVEKTALELIEKNGLSARDAEAQAWRTAANAGWFSVGDTWKQIGPDIRKKINVRRAEKQPDGRYFIAGVDVFYPNAVKRDAEGAPVVYSADDVRAIIKNTNRSIVAGGQKPGITLQHPTPMNKALGVIPPTFGVAMNWRESDRGEGWAACDLVADEQLVKKWKSGRLTGLSAGIVQDGAGLNRRFGHVAALGSESQALSLLPTTEIFQSEDTLCFSATPPDANFFEDQAMTDKAKAKKLSLLSAALQSAYAAAEAGEPGAEDKIAEAQGAYNAEMGSAPVLSAGNFSAGEGAGDTEVDFEADPAAAFSALKSQVTDLVTENRQLKLKNSAMAHKQRRNTFEAQLKQLAAEGYSFDTATVLEQYDAGNSNDSFVEGMIKFIRTTPRKSSPSLQPAIYGTGDFSSSAGAMNEDEAKRLAEELTQETGQHYSVEDVKLQYS